MSGIISKEHLSLLKQNYDNAEEYFELLNSFSSFLNSRVLPNSPKIEEGESIASLRKEVFEQGVCRIPFETRYDGLGLPFGVYTIAMELLGYADASIALSIGIHNTVSEIVSMYGTEQQRKAVLPSLIKGEKLACFGLTEPTSGSDAKNIGTFARYDEGKYVINGSKTYITNAPESDYILLFARTEKGPTCFLIESKSSGIEFGRNMEKLGMRGSLTSEILFKDCVVERDSIVGKEGLGFEYAKSALNASRIVMGSICVGIAEIALRKAIDFSLQRIAFGKRISEFQLIREKIADMRTRINASRLLCMYASRLKELGMDYSSEAAQAKVFSTESSLFVCDNSIQITAGLGYTNKDIHRHWRDARLLTIGEGTSEILRMLIASKEVKR